MLRLLVMMIKLCESPISIDEVKVSISQLKMNKSPGSDGITAEFYKLYSELLSPFLLQVYTESLNCSELSVNMKQGVICLIPKPKKDILILDNWRPVSLLNNDYKLKSSDAKASKCHLKFSSLMMIFIKLVYLSLLISLKWQ